MKRVLALLLALMLPAASLAEAMRFDMSLTVDEAQWSALLTKQLTAQMGASDNAAYAPMASAFAKLINGARISLYSDEQNTAFELQVGGKSLFDLAVSVDQTQTLLTSKLMPGYALILPIAEEGDDQLASLLRQQDWSALLQGMMDAAAQSLTDVEISTQRGSFAGDAYRGGVECTTIRMDDSDIAAFLRSLITPEMRQFVTALCTNLGLDGETLLNQLEAKHQTVADMNTYSYILRMVSDEAGDLCGVSATLLNGERQLATLSVGILPDAINLVMGAGVGEQNVWSVHEATVEVLEQSVRLSGEFVELTGAMEDGFDYASATFDELDAEGAWTLELTNSDETSLSLFFDAQQTLHHAELADGNNFTEGVHVEAILREDSFEAKSVWSAMNAQVMELQLAYKPTDRIVLEAEELICCDPSSGDEVQLALLDEMARKIINSLSLRILTIIPAELLTSP